MLITSVDRIKINKYVRATPENELNYYDLCNTLNKKNKIPYIECLNFFTDCVVEMLRKNEKLDIKQISKFVFLTGGFLSICHKSNVEVSEEVLDKIRSFKEFYDEYASRMQMEKDSQLYDKYMSDVVKEVDKLYPRENKSESVSKYINRISELEKTIKQLKHDLTEITSSFETLKNSNEKKSRKVEELSNKTQSLENDNCNKSKEILRLKKLVEQFQINIQNLEKLNEKVISLETDNYNKDQQILELQGLIEQLQIKIKELKDSFDKVNDENCILRPFIEKCENLNKRVEKLFKDNLELTTKIKREDEELLKRKKIKNIIYQKLLDGRFSIDELITEIKKQKIETNRHEIVDIMREIKRVISIDEALFSSCPKYRITPPILKEGGILCVDIPSNLRCYDLMLVSDFHIKDINLKILKGFEELNDYCVRNNIKLVLNIGDMFDGVYKTLNFSEASQNYKTIEHTIAELPRADGVYHALLGGNHEKSISKFGFDPVSMLVDSRDDFVNLGYTHSTVSFTDENSIIGNLDLHHPDVFDFPITLDDDTLEFSGINAYLDKIYAKEGRTRDDSYMDIFGHTHKSQFNFSEGYCYIPPFYGVMNKRGACHLRVFFDETKNIKYLVFMPLGFDVNSKFVKNNEIVYQKTLTPSGRK